MDIIEISNLRLRAIIGFSPHERHEPQDVVINLRVGVERQQAGETDNPKDACNYKTLAKAVIQTVENSRYDLVEKLAEEIARTAVIDHQTPYIEVAVHKPGALRRADTVGIRIQRRPQDYAKNLAYVSLGSNISPEENLRQALRRLRQYTTLLAWSPVYRSEPQGYTAQAHFLNMAAKIHTLRSPLTFKREVIDRIEAELGRIRDPQNKNAPRTIDLDISLWNRETLEFGERPWKVPDEDLLHFAHIAVPLADIAADYRHPIEGKTLAEIASALNTDGLQRVHLDFSL